MSPDGRPQHSMATTKFLVTWFDRLAASGFDRSIFLDALSEDLVWTETGHSPVSGTFNSKSEYIANVWKPLTEHLQTWPRPQVLRILADGEWATLEFEGTGGVGTNGTDYNLRYCWVIRVQHNLITEVTSYYDQTKVAELFAMGAPIHTAAQCTTSHITASAQPSVPPQAAGAPSDVLALPDTAVARAALDLVATSLPPSIAHHSIRSFLFARLIAPHLGIVAGADYDEQLLFAGCVMHDVALGDASAGTGRFEVVGADLAAALLTTYGLSAPDVDAVWEAIALHSSAQISHRRGPLCLLVREGVAADFGGAIGPSLAPDAVSDVDASTIHHTYPRLAMASSLVHAICRHAAQDPANAPRFTLPGELLRERGNPPQLTLLEHAAAASRWGS